MQKLLLVFISSAILFFSSSTGFSTDSIYCGIESSAYLSGMFIPEKTACFASLQESGIPCDEKKHYLRTEAAAALKKMLLEFNKENPGIKIIVRSSFRSFYDQRYIWNSKFDGITMVSGKNLKKEIKDPLLRSLEILKFSSMPGTSRHHWGTDFDLNSLNNQYYNSGEGLVIYEWLSRNAGKFGFCQPYTSGRKEGYSEEKWHWSYKPLSSVFTDDYNSFFNKNIRKRIIASGFSGIDNAVIKALIYVNAINGDCR